MKKKMLFIYNPRAGKSQIRSNLLDMIDIFVKAGYEVTAYPTQAQGDGIRAVTERQIGYYDMIACSGGDGTLDEVVTGMMRCEKRLPIGYVPAGTTNDFAGSLGIPRSMEKAARVIVDGRSFRCDVGGFNENIFVYIAAFGLFTDVSYQTKQSMKNVLGHLAYVLEGATRIFDIPSYKLKVTHDGETIEDEFIYGMVTNSKSVGGFRNMIGKNVVFDDGEFEVTLIRTPKNPIALQEIVGALLSSQINTKHIYSFKTGEIHFESVEEIPWTLDGEFGGEHDSVCIKNAKQALKIVVPEEEQ